MKWLVRVAALGVLVALVSWLFVLRPGGQPVEDRDSLVDAAEVESSVRPDEEAKPAEAQRRRTRLERKVEASRAHRPGRTVALNDRHDEAGRLQASPESETGADAALDDLQERIRSADALPAERHYIAGGQLNARTSMEALGSDAFSKAIEELAREAYGDFDAQALSDVYGEYVRSFLEAGDGFALDRLVCGMRVCMGEAIALSEIANWPQLGLYSSRYDGPPMFASAYGHFVDADGFTVYQFIFTTDPQSRGITLPSP